ncbi:DUF6286 domain-containing protein [Nocardioides marmoraquaticus]
MSGNTTTSTQASSGRDEAAVAAAKPPVGVGASPLVAQLLALALVALGVVGVQDLLARTGVLAQDPWLDTVVTSVDGVASDSPWVLVGGIVAVAVGLLLLPVAFRRRPRKAVELKATTGVRLRTQDLSKLVRGSLEAVDGVTDVEVRSSGRTLKVTAATVVSDERRSSVSRELRKQLAPTLHALETAPKPKIKVKEATS